MHLSTLPCELFRPPAPSGKLVVVLHGRGDSSKGFHWMPRALGLPGVSYLLVNAPDPWYGGRSWYGLPPDHLPGVLRSRDLLDRLFDELTDQGQAPEDTALFGFSQGCLMTLEWGGRTALPLAGCSGASGYVASLDALVDALSDAAKARPWLITHGRADPVVPFDRTARQIEALIDAGLPVDFQAYAHAHTIGEDLVAIRAFLAGCLGVG